MNRLANRTTIALFLIIVLLAGSVFFLFEYLISAENNLKGAAHQPFILYQKNEHL